jgi:hypothetical protein
VEQQVDKTGGAYADMPGGRSGNLAVELNDNQTEIDTIVRLNPRGAGTDKQNQTFLEFSLGGGGTTIQIVRAIAQWTQGSANAPVYVSQIGWLFQAYLLDSVTGQPTYDQNGIVKVFIRTTYPEGQVQPVNGVYTSTVLKDQGDYFGILTGQTQLEPVLNMELPIYLVPNSYTERLIPTYFACTDNGLQITYERIRIPNGVSNGTYIP